MTTGDPICGGCGKYMANLVPNHHCPGLAGTVPLMTGILPPAPGIADAEMREIARAICKSRTCEGGSCCQWPAMMARRIDCPVRRGAYDEAARDALAAMRAVASRTRQATPAPDAMAEAVTVDEDIIEGILDPYFSSADRAYGEPRKAAKEIVAALTGGGT